jgi:hypothetical protein
MKNIHNGRDFDSSECVIKPLTKDELKCFLDDKSKKIIKYFITKSLFSQPEAKPGQANLPIQIPKEHIEQWFAQSLDVMPVGSGSYPIDIYNEVQKWGADIKMLSMEIDEYGTPLNRNSGEASLGQKFQGPGVDLDSLFKNRKMSVIKDLWIDLFTNKYSDLKKDYPIEKIYYLFILRPSNESKTADFYFMGALLDTNNLSNVTMNQKRSTDKSTFLENFINPKFGNTKIYKAKKRLELRLRPLSWIQQDKFIKIETSFISTGIHLRNVDNLENYLSLEIEKTKKLTVKFID